MGELHLHNLNEYLYAHNANVFVETGTGKGEGLAYACKFDFDKLYSIEFVKDLFDQCETRFQDDPRVTIKHNNSLTGLENLFREDIGPGDRCLFWLDAHFPGADFHYNSYDYLKENKSVHMPLAEELHRIRTLRDCYRDVFIIDDLQLYEEGDFELADPEFVKKYGKMDNSFITDNFSETHKFIRDFRHQGFLIMVPK
tara:strand:- start:276 stop:869 length:594 start_codon:yes stop_codon:yes gene_type:complete